MSDKVYDRAWKLLCDPSRWCQNNYAQDISGNDVNILRPEAVRWCTIGAIFKVYPKKVNERLNTLHKYLGGQVDFWNDYSDHQTVVRVLQELDI